MIILGIETSCDETAVAILESSSTKGLRVISSVISSQVKLHARWGGVVPNLAAREHVRNIVPVFREALAIAKKDRTKIDLITVTQGPGLIPALLVGTNFARTLSYAWKKPLLGIHHIEGHIYANFIKETASALPGQEKKISSSKINFPVLALVVSGGHTQLVLIKRHLHYQIIGETLDDATGEAFDKVARILGLGYPGGPAIAKTAKLKIRNSKFKINLPRPLLKRADFNFSFSGLKTAVLYETKKNPDLIKNEDYVSAVASEFQQAVVDVLVTKTVRAAQKHKPRTIVLAGGVSANQELRQQLGEKIARDLGKTSYVMPEIRYSLDNAAMIAAAGYYRWQKMLPVRKRQLKENWKNLEANAALSLEAN
jgi:N6-L-threonylcarbamoyladenine synthase